MYSIAAIALEASGGSAPAGRDVGGGWVLRMAPMMKKRVPMPKAEMAKESLRPMVSTRKKTKAAVATTLTTP